MFPLIGSFRSLDPDFTSISCSSYISIIEKIIAAEALAEEMSWR
jgi:hypothetical protein